MSLLSTDVRQDQVTHNVSKINSKFVDPLWDSDFMGSSLADAKPWKFRGNPFRTKHTNKPHQKRNLFGRGNYNFMETKKLFNYTNYEI